MSNLSVILSRSYVAGVTEDGPTSPANHRYLVRLNADGKIDQAFSSLEGLSQDSGGKAFGVFKIADPVLEGETLTLKDSVFEIVIVNTDSGFVTASDEWNNTDDPIEVTVTLHAMAVGDLLRVEDEIFKIRTVLDENTLEISRAHSNTTAVVHADALTIYKATTLATGDNIEVGLVTDLTGEDFAEAFAAVFNEDGPGSMTALDMSSDDRVVVCNNAVGVDAGVLNSTLTGAGNYWMKATLDGGSETTLKKFHSGAYDIPADEWADGEVIIPVDFTIGWLTATVVNELNKPIATLTLRSVDDIYAVIAFSPVDGTSGRAFYYISE